MASVKDVLCNSSRAINTIVQDTPVKLGTPDNNLITSTPVTAYTDDFIGIAQQDAVSGQNYPYGVSGIMKLQLVGTCTGGDRLAMDQTDPTKCKAVTIVKSATSGAVRVKTFGIAQTSGVDGQFVSFQYDGLYDYVVPA